MDSGMDIEYVSLMFPAVHCGVIYQNSFGDTHIRTLTLTQVLGYNEPDICTFIRQAVNTSAAPDLVLFHADALYPIIQATEAALASMLLLQQIPGRSRSSL